MAWFGQGRDTIEWNEFRDDVLFYRWPNTEIKKGARLVIRPGQRAIFFAGGQLEGVFEQPGTYDVETDITPFLSSLKGWFQLKETPGCGRRYTLSTPRSFCSNGEPVKGS